MKFVTLKNKNIIKRASYISGFQMPLIYLALGLTPLVVFMEYGILAMSIVSSLADTTAMIARKKASNRIQAHTAFITAVATTAPNTAKTDDALLRSNKF